eukprot:2248542-Rhodomonas_salina.1
MRAARVDGRRRASSRNSSRVTSSHRSPPISLMSWLFVMIMLDHLSVSVSVSVCVVQSCASPQLNQTWRSIDRFWATNDWQEGTFWLLQAVAALLIALSTRCFQP